MDWKDDMASSASSEESLIDLARPLADMAKRKVDVVGPSQYYPTHSRPLASSYVSALVFVLEIQLLSGRELHTYRIYVGGVSTYLPQNMLGRVGTYIPNKDNYHYLLSTTPLTWEQALAHVCHFYTSN